LAFVYVGITDDDELERIKAELRQEVAAARAAKEQYEAMAQEYAEKIAELDDLATKTDVTTAQESIEGTVGTATATTTQNIATNEAHTAQNITDKAKAAIPRDSGFFDSGRRGAVPYEVYSISVKHCRGRRPRPPARRYHTTENPSGGAPDGLVFVYCLLTGFCRCGKSISTLVYTSNRGLQLTQIYLSTLEYSS
jgi:hypothetical protein